MSSDLKPGDRAVIIWTRRKYAHFVGRTVVLTGGPSVIAGLVQFQWFDGPGELWTAAQHLIRIPPDSEMRQMFMETEKTREVEHG